jgi:hypothetical protein
MSWSATARAIIQEAWTEVSYIRPDWTAEEKLKYISREYYPWGARENWPYQAWLKAIKGFRVKLTAPTHKDSQRVLPLFEENYDG